MIAQRLKDIADKFGVQPRAPFDPAALGDPAATETGWTPMNGPSANFATFRLREVPGEGLVYRMTAKALFFCALFVATGVGFAWLLGPHRTGVWFSDSWDESWPVLFGLSFSGIGLGVWTGMARRKVAFRLATQDFIAGEKNIRFSDIRAVQVLDAADSDYTSQQINLVCRDNSRAHVLNHPTARQARDDAQRIAALVGCPVWDATRAPSAS